MNNNNNDSGDNILDIGRQLKKERLLKENHDKLEELKLKYSEEQKEEEYRKQRKEKESDTETNNGKRYKTFLFLIIIILLGAGIRSYVASMPVTEQWAELVVSEGLKNQVTNVIYEKYPTLSEAKKQELILQGTLEALNAPQNKVAVETLSELYKESYKDPEGKSYLYEIDPYFFYEIANNENTLTISKYNLFAFIERWAFSVAKIFVPSSTFIGAIFYLPLIFTVLCVTMLFFITKELWNERAGFIAGLFFVAHPIIVEFSLFGFVDTNMLNMFFILSTGLLFLYAIKIFKTKKESLRKYVSLAILAGFIIFITHFFKYTWSAWYVSVGLIAVTLGVMFLLFLKEFLLSWRVQETKRKKVFVVGIFFILVISALFLHYALGKEEGLTETRIEQKLLTSTLKKYLHLKYENPYGAWPEAFSLIKELQTTDLMTFVNYLGGSLVVILSFPFFLYLAYKGLRENNGAYLYFSIAYVTFLILSFRAIRILPYFIPFFAGSVGISVAVIGAWMSKKIMSFIGKEKKVIQVLSFILLYTLLILPIAYPIAVALKEKSNIMPIMDDAIYNSAIFIKEQSNETAKVSAWWDRGTFYKALAEREVHLHSQPHMPTTYWLATIYNTESEELAKNMLSLLNCNSDGRDLFPYLSNFFEKQEAVEKMKEVLSINGTEERWFYMNKTAEAIEDETEKKEYLTIVSDLLIPIPSCHEADESVETYVVVIDDLMPRYSAIQYFAAWDFATEQPDPRYPYTDLTEGGCSRSQSGVYCSMESAQFFLNFTNLDVQSNIAFPKEVYLVQNSTVQYKDMSNQTTSEMTLIVYQRAGYWKMLYIPKIVADSMYVKLMLLDGYNLEYFEKIFDEVHAETSWVKVYKVKWNSDVLDEEE